MDSLNVLVLRVPECTWYCEPSRRVLVAIDLDNYVLGFRYLGRFRPRRLDFSDSRSGNCSALYRIERISLSWCPGGNIDCMLGDLG